MLEALKKNKLIISVDAIRKDHLGCYNQKLRKSTPYLNDIALESVVFHDATSAATSTAMCFSSIFTGRYPVNMGRKIYEDNTNPFPDNLFSDHEEKGFSAFFSVNRSFQEYIRLMNSFSKAQCWWTGRKAENKTAYEKNSSSLRPREQAEFVRNQLQNVRTPWLCWIHLWGFSAPDKPYENLSGFDYHCRIRELDHAIGILFESFRKGTEFFIFADHGYAFFEHGMWGYGRNPGNMVQPVINVPLISHNGEIRGNNNNLVSATQIRHLISHSDQALTLTVDRAFCESRYLAQPDKTLVIRDGQYKCIYYYESQKAEFYDLESDPNENMNYAGKGIVRVQRDAGGGHPPLSNFVIRSDWTELDRRLQNLTQVARAYYPRNFQRLRPFKQRIKKILYRSRLFPSTTSTSPLE